MSPVITNPDDKRHTMDSNDKVVTKNKDHSFLPIAIRTIHTESNQMKKTRSTRTDEIMNNKKSNVMTSSNNSKNELPRQVYRSQSGTSLHSIPGSIRSGGIQGNTPSSLSNYADEEFLSQRIDDTIALFDKVYKDGSTILKESDRSSNYSETVQPYSTIQQITNNISNRHNDFYSRISTDRSETALLNLHNDSTDHYTGADDASIFSSSVPYDDDLAPEESDLDTNSRTYNNENRSKRFPLLFDSYDNDYNVQSFLENESTSSLSITPHNQHNDMIIIQYNYVDKIRAVIMFCFFQYMQTRKGLFWRVLQSIGIFVLCYLATIESSSDTTNKQSQYKWKTSNNMHGKFGTVSNIFRIIRNLFFSRKTILLLVYVLAWVYFCNTAQSFALVVQRGWVPVVEPQIELFPSLKSESTVHKDKEPKELLREKKMRGTKFLRKEKKKDEHNPSITDYHPPFSKRLSPLAHLNLNTLQSTSERNYHSGIAKPGLSEREMELFQLLKGNDHSPCPDYIDYIEYERKQPTFHEHVFGIIRNFFNNIRIRFQKMFPFAFSLKNNMPTLSSLYEIWMNGNII